MKNDPLVKTVFPWLRNNLGKSALAGLTSTDAAALTAAVQVVNLYYVADLDKRPAVLDAFRACVESMQEPLRELAFHAIAHVADWGHRQELWTAAGLPLSLIRRRCVFEPGGLAANAKQL